jgi:chemotaxis protein MotB
MNSGEDGQNYLVSVSDLMAGLIFVFIITLMIFALRFQMSVEVLQGAESRRTELLRTLEADLSARDLRVTVDTLQGILRLTEQSINFPSGSADPEPAHLARVRTLAEVLDDVLPCFVSAALPRCERDDLHPGGTDAASVSVLLLEGHTDSRGISLNQSRFRDNLELSGARSASIHRLLVSHRPFLSALKNSDGAEIVSISGYGFQQLLVPEDPLNDANRRIELRFLMEPPRAPARVPRAVESEMRRRQ